MKDEKRPATIAISTLVVLLTVACGTTEPTPTPVPPTLTPVPPTATPTPLPHTATPRPIQSTATATPIPVTPTPTSTPTPAPNLITSAEELIGLWHGAGRDAMYQRFNEDGTCQLAWVREALDTNPNVQCTYRFEGTQLILTEISTRGSVENCREDGIYQVEIVGRNKIQFVRVEDTCGGRYRTTAVMHERVRP